MGALVWKQVFVQKSYLYGKARQQDEAIDGGMFLQVGIHAARLVEHAGGVRITSITGWETAFGSPEKGEGKMAGAVQMGLENGGIATIILNYLNPSHPDQPHGNETLRVFGTKGFVESVGWRGAHATRDGRQSHRAPRARRQRRGGLFRFRCRAPRDGRGHAADAGGGTASAADAAPGEGKTPGG